MIKQQLSAIILDALAAAQCSGELPMLDETPVPLINSAKQRTHGDYASNIALVLAGPLKLPPRQVAGAIVRHLKTDSAGVVIEGVDVAGPGFLNFRLGKRWLHDILTRIVLQNEAYGKSPKRTGKRVLVEYVSANPNGPITVAHGRGGAIGDAVSALLEACGDEVEREFYINDAVNSTQMFNFGKSVFLRYLELLGKQPLLGETDPDWLYRGDYVADIARGVLDRVGSEYEDGDLADPTIVLQFSQFAQNGMIELQQADLKSFGIRFDRWYSENELHLAGAVTAAIDRLKERGHTYEQGGALWFRSTSFGDDKDRVLLRADGAPTYIAGDIAYHLDKLERGYDLLIDVWGADHVGYVARSKAAIQALGFDRDRLDILLFQLVRIMKDGEMVRASKRRGNVLELKADLIDEIGKDAARFFFLMRSSDTGLDIDLDLAREQSSQNPVYYVQYAHARSCNVLEKAKELGETDISIDDVDLSLLCQETEEDLIRKLGDWPEELELSAKGLTPHRITHYMRDLASVFHTFYDAGNNDAALRVLCDDLPTRHSRLVLTDAVRIVFRNALHLLGLNAPQKMLQAPQPIE